MIRTVTDANREWFRHLAANAEQFLLHPENRETLGRELLKDIVDKFAGLDRADAIAAFDVLVEVTDLWLDEHDPAEKAVLEGEVEDALRVLVPEPARPVLRVASAPLVLFPARNPLTVAEAVTIR